ncbi:STAS domain-containing protein [Streptomyces sp. NPDC060333]|uniref:STAS domain-containing protein n=1 Tax=Streptomyces sp. NPDC060333 TaxID=3347098 RepID=UPI00366361A3
MSVLPDRDGQRIVRCSGEFDADTLAPLKAAVDTAADFDIDRLVLDVRRVAFADSSFLNLLLAARGEHDVRLVGPVPRPLARLMEMTGAHLLFDVEEDTPDQGG